MIKATLRNEAFKLCLKENLMTNSHEADCHEMKIFAAKRDTAAVQLLISSDSAASVCITEAAHFSKFAHAYQLRLAVSGELQAEAFELGMMTDDDDEEKADILIPSDFFELATGSPRAVYIRFNIPENVTAGKHEMTLTLFGNEYFKDEELLDSFKVTIEVAEVALPEKTTFKLDLWQHCSNIARRHEVHLWSDEHFAVLEEYVKSLSALGQKSATIIVSEIPWRGQSCHNIERNRANLFEYSMIRVERLESGKFTYDFSVMKRYIALCEKYGTADEIEVFGLVGIWTDNVIGKPAHDYPDATRIRYFDHAKKLWCWVESAAVIEDYIRALENYFKAEKLIEKVRISADEPGNIDLYRTSLSHLLEIAPSFRLKTAINHAEFINEFNDVIDSFAPSISCVSWEWSALEACLKKYPDKIFQWYVCCSTSDLNNFLKCSLLESRYFGIFTSYMNFDGFLRWDYATYTEDPRKDIRYGIFPAGDMNFVYPSYSGKPLVSLRYEQLRRGIGDFELLSMAKKKGLSKAVEDFYKKVVIETDIKAFFPDPHHTDHIRPAKELCSLRYEDYNAARGELLAALEK